MANIKSINKNIDVPNQGQAKVYFGQEMLLSESQKSCVHQNKLRFQ